MRKCCYNNCPNEATHAIQLILAVHGNHPPAVSTPIQYVCDTCRIRVTWAEWVEKNWENICVSIEQTGKMRPTREFSKIVTVPLTEFKNPAKEILN